MNYNINYNFLNNVLVLTTRKSFWASKECQIFPYRIYSKRLLPLPGRLGSSRNPINNLTVALQGYLYYLIRRPKLILFGSATRIVPWFAQLKQRGLLQDVKLVATNQGYLKDSEAQYLDKIIVYSRKEITLHDRDLQGKYIFIPLPADGQFNRQEVTRGEEYIFAGGGAGRDFSSLIEAIQGIDIKVRIVTFNNATLGYGGILPENCQIFWRIPLDKFLEMMANSLFVVLPLKADLHPHGHTTIVQALSLGKAIITTRDASVEDYVTDNREGILVIPRNVSEYRKAILTMIENKEFRKSCERNALARALDLTYELYAIRLSELCFNILHV